MAKKVTNSADGASKMKPIISKGGNKQTNKGQVKK